jgi:cell division protein FtsX
VTLRWTLRRLRREAGRRAGSLTALAAAVALVAGVAGGALLGARTTRAIEPLLEHNVHVIAYLGDELAPAARERLVTALRQIPGVDRARLVEPDEALARLRAAAESLGGAPAVSGLEAGFLPRSVEISVAGGAEMPARTAELAARLRKLPGVVEVDAMSAGLARLLSWMALGRRLGLGALAVAGLAGAVALGLAVTAGRGRRRREAEVLALLGETPSGIRRVASISGAAAALLGAGAALAGLLAVFPRVLRAIEGAVGLGPLASVPALANREIAIGLVLALGLGWLAGHLATPRGAPRT